MVEPSGDQDFLRSIFLMEASDALVVVEEGVARLMAGGDPPWDDLFLVTHRLRAAAGRRCPPLPPAPKPRRSRRQPLRHRGRPSRSIRYGPSSPLSLRRTMTCSRTSLPRQLSTSKR